MAFLHVSQCDGNPAKIDIAAADPQARTTEIICQATPVGAVADVTYTVRPGGAVLVSPLPGTPIRHTVDGNGHVKQNVTLAPTPDTTKVFASIDVVFTEVVAAGGFVPPPQTCTAIIRIR